MNLRAPCQLNCPAGIDVPSYVALIGDTDAFEEAIDVIRTRDNPFPSGVRSYLWRIHARAGVSGDISINRWQSKTSRPTAAKVAMEKGEGYKNPEPKNRYDEKVAVIGSGPAGLTAAYFLALEGYRGHGF